MAVMANQACMVFDFFCLFIAWHFETTIAPRKRERNILVPFPSMYAYGSRVSLTGEEEEEEERRRRRRRRKKMTIFDFFKIRLLSFCTAELKSEDTQEGQGFQWIFILLAKPTNHMPFYPCLLYCQNISTTLIPT